MGDFFYKDFDLKYDEAKEKLKKGAILVDVRGREEYEYAHAQGSINIPVDELEGIKEIINDINKEIILYCRSGSRSEYGKMFLKFLGYTNVFNLGGLSEWKGDFK